ncbi:MAG: helix-turn-helix domain-containing protein [Actinobacteria bacterium]|nr:helix-turn-helix domain-containing protein [Actinomycetota bacterium]MCL5882413.1 helix-turn-helix domain-containing protein [Actinomycetota bacterium]
MAEDLKYRPVRHDHEKFLKKAQKRAGFKETYDELGEKYSLVSELIRARAKAGLTQEAVAARMGTTKSAVSRLEAVGKVSPSVTTLKKYANAVGCEVEIKLVPTSRKGARHASTSRKRAAG